ncbi:pectinesterase inhibitor 12-like [Magnolia sinica]|uniref:pectinesterase inhibitor 12-like n=1 Tax=Magnolia sinica TaxID=86752 RepID=UPI0026581BDE|nr:pectinesterase inhibitor 12-like [Magnolia sinica]
MKMSTLPFKLLLLFIVLLVSQSYASKSQGGYGMKQLRKTCKRTTKYNQCVKSLRTDSRSFTANECGLAKIALEIALADANKLYKLSISRRKKKGVDDATIRALESCTELYGGAIDGLQQAVQAMDSKDYKNAKVYAGQAINAADTCNQEFKEFDLKIPFTKKNEAFGQLCSAALDLVSLL